MNKEEIKEYLSENLALDIRNDLIGNHYLVLTLEDELITQVNLEQLFDEDGGTYV